MDEQTGTPTEETQERAEQTTELVEAAGQEIQDAVSTAPNEAIKQALNGLSVTLQDIKDELAKLTVQQAEKQTAHIETAPEVHVAQPEEEKSYRYIRRFNRKVKREVRE